MTSTTVKTATGIEIEPAKTADKSIIWLHGLGADGHDFVPLVPELHLPASLNIRFIFPHAPIMPITLNNGYEMRAWYDISSLTIDGISDKIGIEKSVQFVNTLIAKEVARGIETKNIILAGFSQGAVIALVTGLCCPDRLGGIIALSGYLPLAAEIAQKASKENRQIPIFLAHGTEDNVVPYPLGKAAHLHLKQAAYAVSWHTYPIGHSVNEEEIADISEWIQARFT